MSERIAYAPFEKLVMSADEAAQFVNHGDRVGISGFTGAGYPKALPTAIAEKAKAAHEAGEEFKSTSSPVPLPPRTAMASWLRQTPFASAPHTTLIRHCAAASTMAPPSTRMFTSHTLASRWRKVSTVTSR